MQYAAKTPKDYLQLLEGDWRYDKLISIREMIMSSGPELTEGIQYKMLCYGKGEDMVFHLNAQKNYVSLYIGDIDKVADGRTLLAEFDMGKGCIRVKKKNDLSNGYLRTFIENVLEFWRRGGDIKC